MCSPLRRTLFALAAAALGQSAVRAQPPPPAHLPPPPAQMPPPRMDVPPPVVDMTPVDLPDRPRGGCLDCATCTVSQNKPPALLTSVEYLLVRPYRRGNDYAIADPLNNATPEGSIRAAE